MPPWGPPAASSPLSSRLGSRATTPRRSRRRLARFLFGEERLTRDVPNVGATALEGLDVNGLTELGREVSAGDILIGRASPRRDADASPEEKLLRSIFGDRAGSSRDPSVRVPRGMNGRVTDARLVAPGHAVVEVSWRRTLEVGDVIVDAEGRRAVVSAIGPQAADVAWHDRSGTTSIAKVACARERLRARGIGPYDLLTQLPTPPDDPAGGQRAGPALIRALIRGGAAWSAWELLTVRADAVRARTLAFEAVVRGEHPVPVPEGPGSAGPDYRDGIAEQDEGLLATQPEAVQLLVRLFAAAGFAVDPSTPSLRASLRSRRAIVEASLDAVSSGAELDEADQPVSGGLLCARIFGPVRDFECRCGKYTGMQHRGVVCEVCGVEVTVSRVRRERPSYIALPFAVPHPWLVDEIARLLTCEPHEVRRLADARALHDALATIDLPSVATTPGPRGELARALVAQRLEASDLALSVVSVLPAGLRGEHGWSALDEAYRRILDADDTTLVDAVEALWDALRETTESVRASVHTKPVDFSAMASVHAVPALDRQQCELPLAIGLELFAPALYALLVDGGYTHTIRSAKEWVAERRPEVVSLARALAATRVVYVGSERAIVARRVRLAEAPSIGVDVDTAERLGEWAMVYVPWLEAATEEGEAFADAPLEDPPTPQGWFGTALVGDVVQALQESAIGGVSDPVDEPELAVALGRWPGPPPTPGRWLDDALREGLPRPEPSPPSPADPSRSIDELELSIGSHVALNGAGIRTVGELCALTESDLLRMRGIGRQHIVEIVELLASMGLRLG
ncbi:MAG: DNA-directed RNA polymerase subunit alpha C-terminal domain-containing protein [Myxococcota bacterium]